MTQDFETLLDRAQGGDLPSQHQLALVYARRGQMTRARRWLKSAADDGYGDAENELALMALHGVGEPADSALALAFFERAYEHGSAEAAYQLATLAYTRGLEGLDEQRAAQFLRSGVERDFPAALRIMGMLSLKAADQADLALPLLQRAAFHGDPLAQHYLGAGLILGRDMPKDESAGYAWLQRAAQGGAYVAQAMLNDAQLNESQRCEVPEAATPALPDVSRWHWPEPKACEKQSLNDSFEAYSVEGILSAVECEYLINIASPLLRRSATIDPGTGQPTLNELRTSSSMNFDSSTQDIVLEWIERRMAVTAGMPVTHGEPLSILRYRLGEEYQPHYDYIPLDSAEAEREFATRGQRLLTIFTYLSDVEEGGGTDFPELKVQVPAIRGNAVMFRNCDDDRQPDPRSLHAGMPVKRGEKWLAVLWLRDRPWVD